MIQSHVVYAVASGHVKTFPSNRVGKLLILQLHGPGELVDGLGLSIGSSVASSCKRPSASRKRRDSRRVALRCKAGKRRTNGSNTLTFQVNTWQRFIACAVTLWLTPRSNEGSHRTQASV